MRRIEDIKFSVPIWKIKGTKTGASANIDTLGAEDVLLSIMTGSVATAEKFLFYHASASTASSGNATAFTTSPSVTTAATASQRHGILIEGQVGRKRYVVVKLSTLSASNHNVVTCHQFANRAIPSTSTLGSYTSLVRPLV
jgi:hypothetical protein